MFINYYQRAPSLYLFSIKIQCFSRNGDFLSIEFTLICLVYFSSPVKITNKRQQWRKKIQKVENWLFEKYESIVFFLLNHCLAALSCEQLKKLHENYRQDKSNLLAQSTCCQQSLTDVIVDRQTRFSSVHVFNTKVKYI